MTVYLDLVAGLNFAVDFLLLWGTNCLCGFPSRIKRTAAAAALGGVYGGICLLPGFSFMGNTLWRLVSLMLMALIAFGHDQSAVRRGIVFVLLSMALGGIALGLDGSGAAGILLGAVGIALMCAVGFRGRITGQKYVDVILRFGNRKTAITALRDTGNMLKDPITGESVTVVGSDIGCRLLGLNEEDFLNPIEAMEKHPAVGFRLIPFRAVGQPSGMLLAVRMDEVLIGNERAGSLVAFAPQPIGASEGYQALTGGVI